MRAGVIPFHLPRPRKDLEEHLDFFSLLFFILEEEGRWEVMFIGGHCFRHSSLEGSEEGDGAQKNKHFFLSCSCMVFLHRTACVRHPANCRNLLHPKQNCKSRKISAEYTSSCKASVLSKLCGRKEAKMREDDDEDESAWRRRERNRRGRSYRAERRQARSVHEFGHESNARRGRRGRSRQRRQRKPNGQEAAAFARRWNIGRWISTPHADRRVQDAAKSARVGTPWLRNIWMAGRKEGRVCNVY